ncbi:hypothetical protein PoB_002468900 [Plakobranchus ocellatus]|uniref:Uncharacterized protein n=1 Tax=Plakobranchus ocellatus TaxID=259542 RepID=A0AAV3ZW88_9GAST|nr:hypothetical protein PoB_002468900 [Plakobranchus ocellatus]
MLPPLDITNKLLVQLVYLKEDGLKPEGVITEWLADIEPDVKAMAASSSHFSNFAISAKKKFLALPPEQRGSFLCTSVELDCITQHLCQLGVTRRTFPTPSGDNGDIRERRASVSNQTVVDLEQFRVAEGQPQKLTFQWLHCLTGLDTSRLPSFVKSTMGTYSKLGGGLEGGGGGGGGGGGRGGDGGGGKGRRGGAGGVGGGGR